MHGFKSSDLCPVHRLCDEVTSAANYILLRQGMVRISELAARDGLGVRQFERNFLREVGWTPKVFARVVRLRCALHAKVADSNRTWLGIAHEFGYYDQMHMIHDFEKLGGSSPGKLLDELMGVGLIPLTPSDCFEATAEISLQD